MVSETLEFQHILPKNISKRYHIVEKLGDGGMGFVYLAEDTELERKVAIKTIRPELAEDKDIIKRIDRECKMHAAVKLHPHIVGLYDRVSDGHNIFLIMEYVEGKTLSEIILSAKETNTPIAQEIILAIIIQFLDALSCIHDHGIIHRDIKPSNLIVSNIESGFPITKLMDFGIARAVLEDSDATKLTMIDSGGPGTPAYMAPERIDSKTYGDICPATDLYAIGVILYEMYTLHPPFQGTLTEVLSGHLARVPDMSQLDDIPTHIQHILNKSLKKHPKERYQDGKSFASSLQNVETVSDDKTLPATSFDLAAIKALTNHDKNNTSTNDKKSGKPLLLKVLGSSLVIGLGILLFLNPFGSKQPNPVQNSTDLPSPPTISTPTQVNNAPTIVEQPVSQDVGTDTASILEQTISSDKDVEKALTMEETVSTDKDADTITNEQPVSESEQLETPTEPIYATTDIQNDSASNNASGNVAKRNINELTNTPAIRPPLIQPRVKKNRKYISISFQ